MKLNILIVSSSHHTNTLNGVYILPGDLDTHIVRSHVFKTHKKFFRYLHYTSSLRNVASLQLMAIGAWELIV